MTSTPVYFGGGEAKVNTKRERKERDKERECKSRTYLYKIQQLQTGYLSEVGEFHEEKNERKR